LSKDAAVAAYEPDELVVVMASGLLCFSAHRGKEKERMERGALRVSG
jgi:hypothetical protein